MRHAPNQLQIEWDIGVQDSPGSKHDLTYLLQMQAHNSSHSIHFVPESLVDGATPETPCNYCFEEYEAEERGDIGFDNWIERCTCAPEDIEYDDWVAYQWELIGRTDIMLAVISHTNEAWQQDIRAAKMEVQCIFAKSTEPITFRITCKERFCEASAHGDTALHTKKVSELLKKWGMFDLSTDEMVFVIAFKTEEKVEDDGYELISTETCEVRFTKAKSG